MEKIVKQAGLGTYIKGFKNFSGTNTGKFLNTASKKFQNSFSEGLDYLSKNKEPGHLLGKEIPEKITTTGVQKVQKPTIARGIRTSLGNTAANFKNIGKNMEGKSIAGKAKQGIKNLGDTWKKQSKGDLYKEVYDESDTIYQSGGNKYLKSKAPFLKDRKIVSSTDRGSHLVRKRKGLTPLSLAAGISGPAVGATTYAMMGDDYSTKDKLQQSAVDTALFTVSPAAGMANAMINPIEPSEKNKKFKRQLTDASKIKKEN